MKDKLKYCLLILQLPLWPKLNLLSIVMPPSEDQANHWILRDKGCPNWMTSDKLMKQCQYLLGLDYNLKQGLDSPAFEVCLWSRLVAGTCSHIGICQLQKLATCSNHP